MHFVFNYTCHFPESTSYPHDSGATHESRYGLSIMPSWPTGKLLTCFALLFVACEPVNLCRDATSRSELLSFLFFVPFERGHCQRPPRVSRRVLPRPTSRASLLVSCFFCWDCVHTPFRLSRCPKPTYFKIVHLLLFRATPVFASCSAASCSSLQSSSTKSPHPT